ncbi:hypothetical protein QUV50_04145 [Phascolarctobacterium faecium]|nr:hypothetical protein [Phascolarctobacterium faecium]MDM8110972.1 hypothetical protein [Phascolarctobacterium faecium]
MSIYGLKKYGIDVIIFDSSSDNKTEAVVRNFQIDGCTNLKYYRWKGEYDDFSIDNKVIDAYKIFSVEYEYIWIHKDDFIINPDIAYNAIKDAILQKQDIIVINAKYRDIKNIGNKKYNDVLLLFKEQCMQMTILGATIIKKDIIMNIIKNEPLKKEKNYGMWQPIAFFYYFAEKKIIAQSIVDDIWIPNPSTSTNKFLSKNTIKQWGYLWPDLINKLPKYYDKEKSFVLNVQMPDFRPFYAMNLLKLRAIGGLNLKDIKRYQNNILKIAHTSIYKFYIISIIPTVFAKYLVKNENGFLIKFIKAFYYVICGIVPGEKEILE